MGKAVFVSLGNEVRMREAVPGLVVCLPAQREISIFFPCPFSSLRVYGLSGGSSAAGQRIGRSVTQRGCFVSIDRAQTDAVRPPDAESGHATVVRLGNGWPAHSRGI